ncbi:hypothetical protein P280DRAFT_407184 [Massarina eburnea CBS 473.64]|uniref:Uncharacterized protein n=1 Tax=Massarina eburnea CBS 473.64 TaxID=1395130 RepID=A0A6A6RQR1_9PLEO|nr:hypothetical protein P280DRAFT_407184 [Massarina eburnea CBS 473.64]
MPGLFTPHRAHTPAGSRSMIFSPAPRLAFAGEMSARQMIDSDAHETRKRAHTDATTYDPSATSYAFGSSSWSDPLQCSRSSAPRSPPPLANERYELAGGMDRSTGAFGGVSRPYGDHDDYYGLEKQRGMWASPTSPDNGLQQQEQEDGTEDRPNATKPWVFNQIMSLVGGVAGKLVQFCAVPFRGFQSGGGQAYAFSANGEVADKLFTDEPAGPVQQALHSQFPPAEDYGVRSMDSVDSERPRAKRLRTADSWVVVDKSGSTDSMPSTPRLTERRVPGHTRSPSQIPRPANRASISTPVHKRPSLVPVSRRSAHDRKPQGSPKPTAHSSALSRSYGRESFSSPVMLETKATKTKSPLPPDSQRLLNKVRREKFEDEARMRRMSTQMSAMLREAREALGSKFEVEDEYMDDGASDDDEYAEHTQLYPG